MLSGAIARIDPEHLVDMGAALELTSGELFGVEVVPGPRALRRDPLQLAPTPPTTPAQVLVDHARVLGAEQFAQVLAGLAPPDQLEVVAQHGVRAGRRRCPRHLARDPGGRLAWLHALSGPAPASPQLDLEP